MKPSVGRIVHYVSYGTPGGEYESECRAAVVVAVTSEEFLDLAVLNPTGLFFNQNVEYSPEPTGGTWHWPERE